MLLCSGWRVRGRVKSGRPLNDGNQIAECDGLDLGGGKGVGGMWLDLGCFGIRADKGTECERKRRIKDASWFLALSTG